MKKTQEMYDEVFHEERARSYPAIDRFEESLGMFIDTRFLESAARVLACPVKVNPPNWQHGRVIYSLARKYLHNPGASSLFLDVGTAKGFSAVMMARAIADAGADNPIVSVDVIDPYSREPRNSVDDVKRLNVFELTQPFLPEKVSVEFLAGGSEAFMSLAVDRSLRVGFAFIDGKHSQPAVMAECRLLPLLQYPGDIAIFDDLQIEPVARAVATLRGYRVETLYASPSRSYAIAVRE